MRIPGLFLIALMPMEMAGAADEAGERDKRAEPVQQKMLDRAVAASRVLDEQVLTADGRELGILEDIVLNQDGSVSEFLVKVQLEQTVQEDATSFQDDIADYGDSPLYEGESRDVTLEEPFTAVPAKSVRRDDTSSALEANLDATPLASLPTRGRDISRPQGGIYLRELIGMQVQLADEPEFGEVDEVLLDENADQVVAYVVNRREGLSSQQFLLPAHDAKFRRIEKETSIRERYGIEAVAFPFSRTYIDTMLEVEVDDSGQVKLQRSTS